MWLRAGDLRLMVPRVKTIEYSKCLGLMYCTHTVRKKPTSCSLAGTFVAKSKGPVQQSSVCYKQQPGL